MATPYAQSKVSPQKTAGCWRPSDQGRRQGRRIRSAGDQGSHEIVVPGGGFALALEARFQCRVSAREVECNLAGQGQVPGGGALAHPAGIFVEADIEYPVQSI